MKNEVKFIGNEIIKSQHKIINLQVCFSVAMVIIMVGMCFNFLAISNNEGRMPVLTDKNINYVTDTHISYQDSNEVVYPFLSDRFYAVKYIWSIGDIVMVCFTMTLIIVGVFLVISFSGLKKKIKQGKKDEK